jgi:tRNA modification GTPase
LPLSHNPLVMQDDTIFALSTARGRAGVAVVRLSGPEAGKALSTLMRRPLPSARRAVLARFFHPENGEALDRGLAIWFPAPGSFTGEDVVEFHLHGGRAVIDAVISALAGMPGLRPAEAGEFTRRAFEEGKLDLSEVEGLADLIAAETEAQRRQALRQMEGGLSVRVEAWQSGLVQASALLEAMIDFADEDLPDDLVVQLSYQIEQVLEQLLLYLDDGQIGERLRDGLHVAIVGPPNAGKSSLLNALLRRDAAIVTPHAGTTRDVIEAHLDLGGFPVTLADTAGLRRIEGGQAALSGREALDIEAEGVRRAMQRAAAADLVLLVFDLTDWPRLDASLLDLLDERTLVVFNKADLFAAGETPFELAPAEPAALAGYNPLLVSAKEGTGLAALIGRLEQEVRERFASSGETTLITRQRHRQALEDARDALGRMSQGQLPELAAEDLRLARRALGRITGRYDVEDVLDRLFLEFCIGK